MPQQALTHAIEDGSLTHDTQKINLQGLFQGRTIVPNYMHLMLPAAPNHCTAQPIRSHTSQSRPRPQHTFPDNPLYPE